MRRAGPLTRHERGRLSGVDLEDLIDAVGRERYDRACGWAWRTAAGEGRSGAEPDPDDSALARAAIDELSDDEWQRLPPLAQALYLERAHGGVGGGGRVEWPDDLADVPHDLADPLWYDGDAPAAERLAVAQALYRAMPCYANLMYVKDAFDGFGREERARLWAEYRVLLAHPDDRLADPVAYSLWVDFYEDRSTATEAWMETSRLDPCEERRLQRVLEMSGPVPFKVKARTYEQLIAAPEWHAHIFKSLLASASDVYGDIKPRAARRWLGRLVLPPDMPGLAELRAALR
jgi:hypothetical protein